MLIAMVMVPIVAMLQLNGWDTFSRVAEMSQQIWIYLEGQLFLALFHYLHGV